MPKSFSKTTPHNILLSIRTRAQQQAQIIPNAKKHAHEHIVVVYLHGYEQVMRK